MGEMNKHESAHGLRTSAMVRIKMNVEEWDGGISKTRCKWFMTLNECDCDCVHVCLAAIFVVFRLSRLLCQKMGIYVFRNRMDNGSNKMNVWRCTHRCWWCIGAVHMYKRDGIVTWPKWYMNASIVKGSRMYMKQRIYRYYYYYYCDSYFIFGHFECMSLYYILSQCSKSVNYFYNHI